MEDGGNVRAATRDILEMEGLEVLEAANPFDALDLYREKQGDIHMILSDIVMPKMSGLLMLDQSFWNLDLCRPYSCRGMSIRISH